MEEQTAQQSFEQTVSSLLGNTVNKTPMKSLKGADKFREEGNAHYKDGRFYEALVAYNESICRALLGSEQLALAYSNRSVIYRRRKMFKKCLVSSKSRGFVSLLIDCKYFSGEHPACSCQ